MLKLVCGFFLCAFSLGVTAQIRLEKLVLKPGEKFLIEGTDILVVDTLVMGDSSHIILNRAKADDYIHARIARIGTGCTIEGSGKRGVDGTNGAAGADQLSPCRQANAGADGTDGANGETGSNLFIYSDDIQIEGSLTINLNGGDGGDGGDGGQGGGGGPGTRVCPGGDGGQGGSGMRGGNGGNGGNLSIQCKRCPDYQVWLGNKLYIKNYAGFGGMGGEAGRGGLAGLGPLRDGRNGIRGSHGEEGVTGKNGIVTFTRN